MRRSRSHPRRPDPFSGDGSRLAAANQDGHPRVWRHRRRLLRELIGHQSAVRRLELAANGAG